MVVVVVARTTDDDESPNAKALLSSGSLQEARSVSTQSPPALKGAMGDVPEPELGQERLVVISVVRNDDNDVLQVEELQSQHGGRSKGRQRKEAPHR